MPKLNHFLALAASILAYAGLLALFYYTNGFHLAMRELDSRFYATVIREYHEWGEPLSAHVQTPMGSLFNMLIPVNIWLNPGWLMFTGLGPVWGPVAAGTFFTGSYMVAAYALARAIDLPPWLSVLSAQVALLMTHSPFTRLYDLFSLNPSYAYLTAIMAGCLALTIRLTDWSPLSRFAWTTLGVAALGFYAIILDSLWTSVLAFGMAPLFVPVVLWAPPRRLMARLVMLAVAGALLAASGLLDYLLTLPSFFARQVFPTEIHSEIQGLAYVSMAWQGWPVSLIYVLLCIGWIAALLRGNALQKCLAAGCLLHGAMLQVTSALFVFTTINWARMPLPHYLEVGAWLVYAVAAIAGWSALLSDPQVHALAERAWQRVVDWRLFRPSPARFQSLAAFVRRVILQVYAHRRHVVWLVVLVILYPGRQWVPRPWAPHPPPARDMAPASTRGILQELIDNLAIHPGAPFRGSAGVVVGVDDTPFSDWKLSAVVYGNLMTQFGYNLSHDLWARDVPTLQEYGQTVTTQMYFLTSRLLARPFDYQTRNAILPTKIDAKIMRMLGVRFLVTDKAESMPSGTLRMSATGNAGMRLFLFELPSPNLGNYSPTQSIVAATAAQAVTTMGSPNFDPMRQVVTDEPLSNSLTAARSATFTPVVGGFKVEATSDGQSLLVLPLQYSNCMRVEAPGRLVRVNLAMTGVLFDKRVSVTLRNDFGYWSTACRKADVADMRRLKVESDGTIHLPPFIHPMAIRGF